ncbi:MAG TPA: hypothetical protein VFI28_04580 [Candidatus Limnocylindrales bacterium]|nr:hypothetical protein [Candidatus Limnocylindrales bacterium]
MSTANSAPTNDTALNARMLLALGVGIVGIAFLSLGFASVALDGYRSRLDASQLASAAQLVAAAPFLVAIGVAHFVAAFGLLSAGTRGRLAAAAVGLAGTSVAAVGLVDLAVAGDPLRLVGNDPASGAGILAITAVLYGAVTLGAIVGTRRVPHQAGAAAG